VHCFQLRVANAYVNKVNAGNGRTGEIVAIFDIAKHMLNTYIKIYVYFLTCCRLAAVLHPLASYILRDIDNHTLLLGNGTLLYGNGTLEVILAKTLPSKEFISVGYCLRPK
jgi:hypothetical protein